MAVRTLVVGLGPIGRGVATLAAERPGVELVGAVDVSPELAGRSLAEILETAHAPAGAVFGELGEALAATRPEVALLCTASSVPRVAPDLRRLVEAGVHVVSSCEELVLPTFRHPRLAAELDEAARAGGAVVVGTGVNPGFVLDLLPVVLSGATRRVDRVRAHRVVDAGTRRRPLQEKVGAGIDPEEFARRAGRGTIGHVGLPESTALLGRTLGLELDVQETLEPVIAETVHRTAFFTVEPGRVAGVRHRTTGSEGGVVRVEIELEMYVGAPDPRDVAELEGEPSLRLEIPGGIPGDLATAAILVNTVPVVGLGSPGLRTVLDLPPARGVLSR